jgi:hypothetical protein
VRQPHNSFSNSSTFVIQNRNPNRCCCVSLLAHFITRSKKPNKTPLFVFKLIQSKMSVNLGRIFVATFVRTARTAGARNWNAVRYSSLRAQVMTWPVRVSNVVFATSLSVALSVASSACLVSTFLFVASFVLRLWLWPDALEAGTVQVWISVNSHLCN